MYISEYIWMDSDHLADLMNDTEENQEILRKSSIGTSNSKKDIIDTEDSQEMAIQEQIDDDEPTFYNDSTKIELQLHEPARRQSFDEPELTVNGNSAQEKKKRFVSLVILT